MQLDLFEGGGAVSVLSERTQNELIPLDIAALSDAALLDAIPNAGFPKVLSLIDEAGRRKLPGAIPVLIHLCRMFTGFGIKYAIQSKPPQLGHRFDRRNGSGRGSFPNAGSTGSYRAQI